ncbi:MULTISPECIES: glycosyltransferase family 2 protein [unclassified Nocardioides]|uniref:glycosyltransferase family 2 protein n=1 Tax=unclassified Nocardioides TaxID=2615069 RepID=UPI0026670CD3|nr:glycosyltransferase family 2 protein [Nocardioides sp. Arc9.136]WKN48603.1 glycosyltransferase family 2 protein [Nocardioides sp. Arc9.136]
MSPSPSVDVVIATRNRPELLRRAIAGVLDQDADCEITCFVVFDQCEPDPSVAEERPGRRVRVLTNTRTPGLAGGRNTGILAGEADLVAFCDDDDVWLPEKLAAQLAVLEAQRADTSVTGITVEYDGHSVDRVPAADELRLENLARRRVMAAHPSSVLVRREALVSRIGLVDEEIPGSYGEDFDWLLRAAAVSPVAVVPRPLVRVRWGGSQFSHQWQTIVDAIDYSLGKHAVFHRDPRALGRLYGRRAFALAALGRPEARRAVLRTVRVAPLEPRAYLAAAVAMHVVSAERLLHLAHQRGHGI